MKYYCSLFVFLLFACKGDQSSTSNTNASEYEAFKNYSGKTLDSIGYKYYSTDQNQAIAAFAAASKYHEKNNDFKSAAYTNLNMANLYDEHVDDKVTALVYAQKSLNQWITLGDKLQQANLFKYVGLLEGLTGNGVVGKQNIEQAIKIYSDKNVFDGIAVSQFDMGLVLEAEENYVEAEKYYVKARKHWADKNNFGRVLANNLLGIRLYHKLQETEKLNVTVAECERIRTNLEVNRFVDQKYIETLLSIGVKEGHDH